MAVLHTLAAIGRFIRRTPPPPAELLEAYAHEVIPVLDRAEWLYQHWLEQSTLFTDGEKLGNVAAIHRWETATMGRSLERVIPPAVLADAHEQVIDALELASRAAQLLSNGSRFHNANAVCEGQAMLAASRDRRLAALKSMRRYLATVQAAVQPPAGAPAVQPSAGATADNPAEPSKPLAGRSAQPAHELAAAERTTPVSPERSSSPERSPTAPIVNDDRTPDAAASAEAPAPDLVATEVPAPQAPPLETPAPETAAAKPPGRPDAAGPETASRSGWGSLFGQTPDQSGR